MLKYLHVLGAVLMGAGLIGVWLTGMIALFALEFIEGNTITRLYFMCSGQVF